MGVKGLWDVLAPTGRRVDIATLQGKVLAVDLSIWLIQFIRAMRTEQTGEMIPNAHILGSLRRILKLLANKVKPVFVFDGGVPVLKRRTIQKRQQGREVQAQKIRIAAEKILLNKLLLSKMSPKAKDLKAAPSPQETNIASSFNLIEKMSPKSNKTLVETDLSPKESESLAQTPEKVKRLNLTQLDETIAELIVGGELDKSKLSEFDPDIQFQILQRLKTRLASGATMEALSLDYTSDDYDDLTFAPVKRVIGRNRGFQFSQGSVLTTTSSEGKKESSMRNYSSQQLSRFLSQTKSKKEIDSIERNLNKIAVVKPDRQRIVSERNKYYVLKDISPDGNSKEPVVERNRVLSKDSEDNDVQILNQDVTHLFEKQLSERRFDSMKRANYVSSEATTTIKKLVFKDTSVNVKDSSIKKTLLNLSSEAVIDDKDAKISTNENWKVTKIRSVLVAEPKLEQTTNLTHEHSDSDIDSDVQWESENDIPKESTEIVIDLTENAKATDNDITRIISPKIEIEPVKELSSEETVSSTINMIKKTNETIKPQSEAKEAPRSSPNLEREPYNNIESLTKEQKEDLTEKAKANLKAAQTDYNSSMKQTAELNQAMLLEVKELIHLLGLPFIDAPMEAEAQCAVLEQMGLVDGVVTDDSDAVVFGAKNIFKNIFSGRRFVEAYAMDEIEKTLGINRESAICMALLLGSDYTQGIKHIGVVNAMEVIEHYPTFKSLKDFKIWVNNSRTSLISTLNENDSTNLKLFKKKHQNARKKWVIPESFPSQAVIDAYLNPTVLNETELRDKIKFSSVQRENLETFIQRKLGFTPEKIKETLDEPLNRWKERSIQMKLDSYLTRYEDEERFAKIKSKRLQKAIEGLTNSPKKKKKQS